MSLTFVLRKPDVKLKFQTTFPNLAVFIKGKLLAPPLTNNYSLVGTAFDYLLRFYIERLNPNAIIDKWVAEYVAEHPPDDIEVSLKCVKIVEEAKMARSEYLKSGTITETLLKSVIGLAQIDNLYRSGKIDAHLGSVEMWDMMDLMKLISSIDPTSFKAKEICVLNPTFGKGSTLVGGADADLIIDDLLIDIKTTQFQCLTDDHFHQIIGYYTLYKIGGIDGVPPHHEIKRLGVYSSRYACLHIVKVEDIIDFKTYPQFLNWFKESNRINNIIDAAESEDKRINNIIDAAESEDKISKKTAKKTAKSDLGERPKRKT